MPNRDINAVYIMMSAMEILTRYTCPRYNDVRNGDLNVVQYIYPRYCITMSAMESLTLYIYPGYNDVCNGDLNAVYLSWI